MKALVLTEYGKFEWLDVEKPSAGPGEVLVRVEACAVCGSDVHGMDGSTGRRIPPIIMGHEAAGVIEAVGEGVVDYAAGERVTFDSTIYCGECEYCRRGQVNLCGNRKVMGVSCGDYRLHGALAEYVAVPKRVLYRLPDRVGFVEASMVEPLAVAYHGVTRMGVPRDGVALVIGAGTIGMLVIQVLRALGAGKIIAVDIVQEKLDFALAHGAHFAVDSRREDAARRILALAGGEGVDAAYDATGISATVNLGLQCVKKGGSMALIGNLAQKIDFPLQWVVTREISLFGSCASAGEYAACLELIDSGQVDVLPLISRIAPMRQGDDWIHKVKRGEDGLTKIVLVPREVNP